MDNDIATLRPDLPNAAVLDAVRNSASTDYQNRIPAADKAGVAATIDALMSPENRRWRNEFVDSLVNRIGMTIARGKSWSNPLAAFKRGMLTYGNTIEEIQVGLLKAHNYSPDRDYMEQTLFGRELPAVQTNFHTVNRQDFYKVTVNEAMLNRAFLESTGLSGFINDLMEAPVNSDNLDEFLLTCSLFAEYERNGGYFHVAVPDVAALDSTPEDARFTLRRMRAMADTLKFLSSKYNAAHMPVFAKPEELVLFVSPEFNAAIDVEALAGAFNLSKIEMSGRIVVIPQAEFGIDGCQAILTTDEFFVMADKLYESAQQWNPASLHNNYFLHHHQIISCSRFAPAVMFTTHANDEIEVIYTPPASVSAITLLPAWDGTTPTGIAHGGVLALSASVNPAGADQGIRWSVTGGGPSTFITQDGILHLGADDPITNAGTLTVTATATSINPDDVGHGQVFATLAIDVLDDALVSWPASGVISDIQVQGVSVTPAFAVGTTAYTVTVPEQPEDSDIAVISNGAVSVNADVVDGDTITVETHTKENATPVTYTITYTVA